jgi:2-dehydro-3-deoxygluconokinase
MHKIVTMGELMLRLQPPGYKRIVQADSFDATYGGGEANVAVSLAQMGEHAVYCTKLPDNPIGNAALSFLRKYGVDTSKIVFGTHRMGIYFIEKGASQRPSKVIYDRADSAFCSISAKELDIEGILAGASWFHFTGITPALSQNALDCLTAILKECKTRGITVSCDLNYRNKLWSKEKAKEVMSGLMAYTNVLIANEEDVADVFGIYPEDTDIGKGKLNVKAYGEIAGILMRRFGLQKVAFTLRESISASVNGWSGLLVCDDEEYISRRYEINIVDRVGGGDSFGAGLIYALLNGRDNQAAIEFAVAASCLKHTIEGDVNLVSVKEIEYLINSGGSGRVQR